MAAPKMDGYRVLNGWTLYVEGVAYGEDELVELSEVDAASYVAEGALVLAETEVIA